jgi:hypothetical protein
MVNSRQPLPLLVLPPDHSSQFQKAGILGLQETQMLILRLEGLQLDSGICQQPEMPRAQSGTREKGPSPSHTHMCCLHYFSENQNHAYHWLHPETQTTVSGSWPSVYTGMGQLQHLKCEYRQGPHCSPAGLEHLTLNTHAPELCSPTAVPGFSMSLCCIVGPSRLSHKWAQQDLGLALLRTAH